MKKILLSGAIILCVVFITTNLYALQVNPNLQQPMNNAAINSAINNYEGPIKEQVVKIWKSFSLIIQLLAVGSVVFAGLRYMFSSADRKADIKQSTVYIVVGAAIIFSLSYLVPKVIEIFKALTNMLV